MQVFNRQKAIDALVDDDLNFIMFTDGQNGGVNHLRNILQFGHEGYEDYTDDELVMECLNRDMPDSYYFDETEDDGQPDEAQEWHDFDPEC